jgi:hypothetical protein
VSGASQAARGLVLIEQCSENDCELDPLRLNGGARNPSLWLPKRKCMRISAHDHCSDAAPTDLAELPMPVSTDFLCAVQRDDLPSAHPGMLT